MGQVFLARDQRLDREVALKILGDRALDAAARERFQTEARAIARLTHPNVVAIYRVGEVAGRPYLVSEYAPGQSLRALHKPLPPAEVLNLAVGLCRGLAAAHQRGVLHRDIKPANVILGAHGEVKLLDFGLAKLLEALPQDNPDDPDNPGGVAEVHAEAMPPDLTLDAALTATGVVVGTPLYLAPECFAGAPASVASDIYALGAVLYELCAGEPPLRAESLGALARLGRERGASPLYLAAPTVPPALAAIIDRCLRRDPADRFPSCEALLEALLPHASPHRREWLCRDMDLAPLHGEPRFIALLRQHGVRLPGESE